MPADDCLHKIFATRAAEAPDRVAVTAVDGQLTYGELDERADRLARRLRARGVGPDVLVGLACERATALIVGMLGILKAGGAYVPIDPTYPDERISLLVRDSGVGLVVSAGPAVDRVPDGVPVVDIDDGERGSDGAAEPPDTVAAARVGARHLAYVIYTSGSTGTPKGVEVEHGNVVRLFSVTRGSFDFTERDVWSCFHSASFDFSVWEIWGALLHGGRLVIVPAMATRLPAEFLGLLRRERVTMLSQTPSAFRQLIAADAASVEPATDLALRAVVFGGERLDPTLLRPWLRRYGDERPRLINMYGITETTVHVTYRRIREADLATPERSPIGVPLADLTVTLHDADGAPVGPGEPGEMWVGGPGVARGYHDRPELTAARFVTGPDGLRAYRSGDRAVRDERGELRYLGRIDDQLKVRGFRIEPHEVETVLAGHPAVAGSVAGARDFGDGDVRLVAYVQPSQPTVDGDAERLADELRRHAATHLPAHLRPSDYLLVSEIPLTPQGKADRAALARST